MKAPIAPPPGKPDSVELLRKRTGTPRIGVPIHDPSTVPVQAPVVLPPQLPVTGVIEPAAPRSQVLPKPAPTPDSREPETVQVQSAPAADDLQPRGKRPGAASADLNISQVWYDEGDQLSGDDDDGGSRVARARKTISPSATDLSFYGDDERPRRSWGLLAAVGVFVVIGGAVAVALTRGGSSTAPSPAAREPSVATAMVDAAPSTIIPADPPAEVVAGTSSDAAGTGTKPPAPSAASSPGGTHRPAATHTPAATHASAAAHASVETHAPAVTRRPPDLGFPVLGSEPTRRPPGSGTGSVTTTPQVRPPDPGTASRAPSLTDNPKDPYGGDEAPSDGATPEKKAEFFANLGSQQLIGGDTVGAAANFKKALELDGKNVAATTGMGEIALRQGLFGDAIVHLSRAAKLAPRSAKVLTLLGEAYLNSGNSAQAAANFKKALQIDPDNARARDGYNEASSRVPPPSDEAP